jgi:hypothetical protein
MRTKIPILVKSLVVMVALGVLFRAYHSPKDASGTSAKEVVSAFVKAVNSGDYESAKQYWSVSSVENIQANYNTNFADFCRAKFECESFSLSGSTRQKAGFFLVKFHGKSANGGDKFFRLYLQRTDGKWTLAQKRWLK